MCTIGISLIRGQIENSKAPRALHCDFPLGRPLGKPADVAFQRKVVLAALELLKESAGPVVVDFPERIADASDQPLACDLPNRSGDDAPDAVAEAKGLREAYDRNREQSGRTLVGRAIDADAVPDAVAAFIKVADGTPFKQAGFSAHPLNVAKDITSYYEEAAAALVDHIPAARAAESWFFHKTATGQVIRDARRALREAKAPFWFYLVPFTQDL